MSRGAARPSIADYPRAVTEPEVPHFYPDRRTDGPVVLTGADLTIADVEAVARDGAPAALDVHARERMQEARDLIESLVAEGEVVYGVTTGFGALASTLDRRPRRPGACSENLLMSHAAGVGRAVPARGRPGDAAAAGEHARARAQRLPAAARRPAAASSCGSGSTRSCRSRGASARRATSRRSRISRCRSSGCGEVERGRRRSCRPRTRCATAGLEPLALEAKEGLALLNGTQLMSAIGALAAGRRGPARADGLGRRGDVASRRCSGPTSRSRRPTSSPGRTRGRSRSPPSSATSCAAATLQTGHHGHAHKVQDPYSLRCMPQVHGAVRDTLDHLRRVLDIELNSATDNPLVFPGGGVADEATIATGGGRVISGGNFHGEPIALALDFAKIALAELGSISERRTALLVDPRAQRRPAAVPRGPSGIDSGLMIYQYTAAALASENKVLAHPASVDSIPTSANQEDHVSMGSISARHARDGPGARRADRGDRAAGARRRRSTCGWRIRASARRGTGRRRRRGASRGSASASRHLDGDREPGPDLAAATALVHEGALADLAG